MRARRPINAPPRRRLLDRVPRPPYHLDVTDNRVAVPIAFALSAVVGYLVGRL